MYTVIIISMKPSQDFMEDVIVPICRAITSSMKPWLGFIDIMMTVYTGFYSTIHLISKSASCSFDFLKDDRFI